MKVDKNNSGIKHKKAENTEPGPNDFRKRINKRSRRAKNDAERPEYHLNNYVGFQDGRNKIFFSLQNFPKMIMNVAPGNDNKKINK